MRPKGQTGAPRLTESDSSKVLKGSFQKEKSSFLLSILIFKSKVRTRMSFSTLVPVLILFSPLFAKFKNFLIEVFRLITSLSHLITLTLAYSSGIIKFVFSAVFSSISASPSSVLSSPIFFVKIS